MQELLARLTALDPGAQMSLRVIACFDELTRGGVNLHALLSAGASMSGAVAGFSDEHSGRTRRAGPDGEALGATEPPAEERTEVANDGLVVWLEKPGPLNLNDGMILERMALAVGLRLGRAPSDGRRGLSAALDPELARSDRAELLGQLGLRPSERHRVVCLPLFATWSRHAQMLEDVVNTAFGPIHVVVVGEAVTELEARPVGIGAPMALEDLDRSFRTALVSLRLCSPPEVPSVLADDYGGLVELLAAGPAAGPMLDVDLLAPVMDHAWGPATVDALVRTGSVRQAARAAEVHHSTMQSRVDELQRALSFDPLDGLGRTRLGIAYLVWRLQHSTVLTAPPTAQQR